jgi:sarcosine oxidase, subunit gamma
MISPTRSSPIHTWLQVHSAKWGTSGDASVALSLHDEAAERVAVKELALCDVSGLAKLGLKGPRAVEWLKSSGITPPSDIFAVAPIAGDGLVARLGNEEIFLEDGFGSTVVADLEHKLAGGAPGVYRVERHDGTFLLCGARAVEVLAQTSGINFAETPEGRVIFTRAAGVSCMILPKKLDGTLCYQIWVDPSYAFDLWHSLEEILTDLGGQVVGIAVTLPAATIPS